MERERSGNKQNCRYRQCRVEKKNAILQEDRTEEKRRRRDRERRRKRGEAGQGFYGEGRMTSRGEEDV